MRNAKEAGAGVTFGGRLWCMVANEGGVGPRTARRAGSRWAGTALAVAVVMGAVIVFAALAAEQSESSDGVIGSGHVSLWQTQPEVAGTIAVVLVGLALVPVLARRSRFRRAITATVAALLGVLTVVGAASIGLFVAPVFALELIGAIRD